jgi:hypothetical protein
MVEGAGKPLVPSWTWRNVGETSAIVPGDDAGTEAVAEAGPVGAVAADETR